MIGVHPGGQTHGPSSAKCCQVSMKHSGSASALPFPVPSLANNWFPSHERGEVGMPLVPESTENGGGHIFPEDSM